MAYLETASRALLAAVSSPCENDLRAHHLGESQGATRTELTRRANSDSDGASVEDRFCIWRLGHLSKSDFFDLLRAHLHSRIFTGAWC